jgi:sugar phosphate isomerase/epimerase
VQFALANIVVKEMPFAEQCAYLASIGYDGIEVAPWTLADEPDRLPKRARAALRRAAEDAGIAIFGFNFLLYHPPGLSITDPDDAVRARTVDFAKRMIELLADLGGRYIVHGSAPQRKIAHPDDDAGRARGIESFRAIAPAAEAAGIDYVIEPLAVNLAPLFTDNFFINSVAEAADIVRAVANPRLFTMVDTLAARNEERQPVPELLDQWLPTGLVRHIHLNDRNMRAPGQGADTFADVIASLVRGGYDRHVTIEPFEHVPDPKSQAGWALGFVRGVLEAIELGRAGAD